MILTLNITTIIINEALSLNSKLTSCIIETAVIHDYLWLSLIVSCQITLDIRLGWVWNHLIIVCFQLKIVTLCKVVFPCHKNAKRTVKYCTQDFYLFWHNQVVVQIYQYYSIVLNQIIPPCIWPYIYFTRM